MEYDKIFSSNFFFLFCSQGHCQAYEYGSNGCIPQGNLPWDDYNHYSAYASGHRVTVSIYSSQLFVYTFLFTFFDMQLFVYDLQVSWPLLMVFTLCAKFFLL